MPHPANIRTLIANAWTDGVPLLVATAGPDGPVIGPKGSMVVYDDGAGGRDDSLHLAYWERTRGAILEALRREPRVCVMYANFPAQRAGTLESGFLRFFGTATLHESGPVKDRIFSLISPREQTHAGADQGIGVLIKVDKAADIRGKSLL
jgi:hypothetical protein